MAGSPGLTAKLTLMLPALGRAPIAMASGNCTEYQSSMALPGPLSTKAMTPLIGGTTPPSATAARAPLGSSLQASRLLLRSVPTHSQPSPGVLLAS